MKNFKWVAGPAIGLYLVILGGCTGEMFVLKPDGDRADFTLADSTRFTAELITIDKELLYVRLESGWDALQVPQKEKIVGFPTRSVKEVHVQGYSNRNWVTPWIALEVVPTIVLSITAGVYYDIGYALEGLFILGAVTGLNGLLLSQGTPPPPRYNNLQMQSNVSELKKYARFPQGLTPEQMDRLAATYGQNGYRILGSGRGADLGEPVTNR